MSNLDGIGTIPLIENVSEWASKKNQGRLPPFAHVKRDGHMLRLSKNHLGHTKATTRRPTDITDKVRDCPWFTQFVRLAPPSTSLVGELWLPGGDRSVIKTMLKDRASAKLLSFDVFGVESHDSLSLGQAEVIAAKYAQKFLPFYATSEFASGDHLVDFMVDLELRDPDVEGMVFVNSNMDFIGKWKPRKTIDLIVSGTKDADWNGKYAGSVGSLLVKTVCGVELAAVSGMTDDQREWMTQNEDSLPGMVVEVAYQTIGSKGRLVHPRFVRWREDKPARDCHLWQDPRLVDFWKKD